MGVSKEKINEAYNMLDEKNELSVETKDLLSSAVSLAIEDEKGQEVLAITTAILIANLTALPNEEIAVKARALCAEMELDQEMIDYLVDLIYPHTEE